MNTKGKLIMIMGPSGSGKNTLKNYVREKYSDQLTFLVSHTSRAMRPGEEEGVDYYFVDQEEFKRMINAGDFIEWVEYGGRYYGTARSVVERGLSEGQLMLTDLEMRGYAKIKEELPREVYLLIFIDGGSWEHLARRILSRAPMSDEEFAMREKNYEEYMKVKPEADFVIVNEDGRLEAAEQQIDTAIQNILASR